MVVLLLPHLHFLISVVLCKYVIPIQGLALITHHVAFNFRFKLSGPWLQYSCHKFTDAPVVSRMFLLVAFLELGGESDLTTREEHIVINGSEDHSYSF